MNVCSTTPRSVFYSNFELYQKIQFFLNIRKLKTTILIEILCKKTISSKVHRQELKILHSSQNHHAQKTTHKIKIGFCLNRLATWWWLFQENGVVWRKQVWTFWPQRCYPYLERGWSRLLSEEHHPYYEPRLWKHNGL